MYQKVPHFNQQELISTFSIFPNGFVVFIGIYICLLLTVKSRFIMINHLLLGSIRTKILQKQKKNSSELTCPIIGKGKSSTQKCRLVQQPELEKHMRCNVLTFGPLIIKSVFQTLLHCILNPFWRCWEPGTCVRNQWPSVPKQYSMVLYDKDV